MPTQVLSPRRVKRQIEGEAIVAGEYRLQLVACVSGAFNHFEGERGLGGGGWLKITPVKAVARNAEGAELFVDFPDANRQATRRVILTSALVAAGALLAMLAAPRGSHAGR